MSLQKSILFVCLGNICRSPACEGICKSIVKDKLFVDSAGTCGYHVGESPDDRSQAVCANHGVNISGQRARQISHNDWSKFDVIAALDQSVFSDLNSMKPKGAKAKLVLFNEPNGVGDPYYGGMAGFEKMYESIYSAMTPFLKQHGLIDK